MKQISLQLNLGIGDQIVCRCFIDPIKHLYSRIQISHAKDALSFWHNNNPQRLQFNTALGQLVFSEPPYVFVPNPPSPFPFFPTARIVRELNQKPIKANIDNLCAGTLLNIGPYIVIQTKVRQFHLTTFNQIKSQLTPALQSLSSKFTIVILGEKEVQITKEYNTDHNRGQVFGLYNYLINIFPANKIIDLTIPALGVAVSSISQFQQDCLLLKEAKAVINLGIGGNVWMGSCLTKTIVLRADREPITNLMHNAWEGMMLTKDVGEFCKWVEELQ
jgi:hypothetical protein